MNVVKSNYEEALQQIESLLPSACFMAFDEEMTGISLANANLHIAQTPAERYIDMKNVVTTYRMIQFGLCLFHKQGDELVARPFNFFAFPTTGTITLDGESTAFNKRHNMNFNQWIYEGIPYLSANEQEQLHQTLFPPADKKQRNQNGSVTLRTPQDKEFVAKVMESVATWSELMRPAPGDAHTLEQYQCLQLPDANSFLRLAMRKQIESLYPQFTLESTDTAEWFRKDVVLLRLSPEEKAERDERRQAEKMQSYRTQLGLRRLFRAMVESKIPLVGHNCMYDLMFMLHAFDALPISLADFKNSLSQSFPTIYDTKYLALTKPWGFVPPAYSLPPSPHLPSTPSGPMSDLACTSPSSPSNSETCSPSSSSSSSSISSVPSSPSLLPPPPPPPPPPLTPAFKNTSLDEVHCALQREGGFKVRLAEGFTRYDQGAAHEAGYDAFMTGCVFSRFIEPTAEQKNMLALTNTFYHLNLSGPDTLLEEDKVIYHCVFNSQWSVSDVQTLFKEAGDIRTKFLDGRSCVVWVDSQRQAQADALTKIHSRKNAGITSVSFEAKTNVTAPDQRKVIVREWSNYLLAREPDYQSEDETAANDEEDEDEGEEGDEGEEANMKRPREADNNPFGALRQKRRKTPATAQ